MSSPPPEVVVVGGGAAGLFAAWRAAERGARVLLLEKNARPGVKILASGGGRCNLTTTRAGTALVRSFREPQASWLRPALSAWTPARLRGWFLARGVATHEEEYEKIFPDEGRARVVLAALLSALAEAGGEIRTETPLRGLTREGGEFRLHLDAGTLLVRRVILATGGASYPKSGTTGDGYAFLAKLGLSVTPRVPALVGIRTADADLHELSGIVVEKASIRIAKEEGQGAADARPLLFTHWGLSGPGPMDLSGEVEATGQRHLSVDLVAGRDAQSLDQELAERFLRGRGFCWVRTVTEVTGLSERVAAAVVARARRAAPLSEEARREFRLAIVCHLKDLRVDATGTRGFDHAEVTRGGLSLDEVDPRTMEAKKVPGLYVAGEILDIDGPIGGFNFQAAFATGFVAGDSAARRSTSER